MESNQKTILNKKINNLKMKTGKACIMLDRDKDKIMFCPLADWLMILRSLIR
jgi:hypothetical protein